MLATVFAFLYIVFTTVIILGSFTGGPEGIIFGLVLLLINVAVIVDAVSDPDKDKRCS